MVSVRTPPLEPLIQVVCIGGYLPYPGMLPSLPINMERFFRTIGSRNARHHELLPWDERGKVEHEGVTVVVVLA